jgi:ribosome recycling factor
MNKEDYKVYSDKMRKSIESVSTDFASVRAGRANAAVLSANRNDHSDSSFFSALKQIKQKWC